MKAIIRVNKEFLEQNGNNFFVTENAMKWAVDRLFQRGEISKEQYQKCLNRW